MSKIDRFRKLLVWVPIVLLSGCASNVGLNGSFAQSRQSMALSLEQGNSFSDALIQWKVLKAAYPNDDNINQQISRLEKIIHQKTIKLKKSLKNNSTQTRIINLRILALEPDNNDAQVALRKIEKSAAFASASTKTENVNKYFKDSQAKAQKSIEISNFGIVAEKLQASGEHKKLLAISTTILKKHPDFDTAINYKHSALVKLGNAQIAADNNEAAVGFYEQALSTSSGKNKLQQQIANLKNNLSQKYYRLGMKMFKSDINAAVKLLQTSLSYNPENRKAARELPRATRIQKKLEQINKLTKG